MRTGGRVGTLRHDGRQLLLERPDPALRAALFEMAALMMEFDSVYCALKVWT